MYPPEVVIVPPVAAAPPKANVAARTRPITRAIVEVVDTAVVVAVTGIAPARIATMTPDHPVVVAGAALAVAVNAGLLFPCVPAVVE